MSDAPQKAKKTKKGRKHGRNKTRNGGVQNSRYIRENRHAKSHARRIHKHLGRFPNDHYARQMLAQYERAIGIAA